MSQTTNQIMFDQQIWVIRLGHQKIYWPLKQMARIHLNSLENSLVNIRKTLSRHFGELKTDRGRPEIRPPDWEGIRNSGPPHLLPSCPVTDRFKNVFSPLEMGQDPMMPHFLWNEHPLSENLMFTERRRTDSHL